MCTSTSNMINFKFIEYVKRAEKENCKWKNESNKQRL